VKCIVWSVIVLLICSNVHAMKNDQLVACVDWAYVSLKGCRSCGVPSPPIPQMKTISLSANNRSDLRSFLNDPSHKTLFCLHSGLGLSRSLSGGQIKKNKKPSEQAIKDNRLYKGPLASNYVTCNNKREPYPWLNVKKYLFTGGNLVTRNIRHNKVVAKELANFFSAAAYNQFDVYDVISKRWPEEFIADIYQASVDDDPLCEAPAGNVWDLMSSVLSCDDELLSFSSSADGVAYAISLDRAQDSLLLLKDKEGEVLVLAHDADPVVKTVFSKNNAVLVAVSSGFLNNCSVWDVETGKEKTILFCVQDIVSAMAVSDDGFLVALFGEYTTDMSKTLSLWNSKIGSFVANIDDSSMPDLASLEFSADRRWLVGRVANKLDYLLLWKIDVYHKRLIPITQYGPFSACAFTASGNLAAFADFEGNVYVLDTHDHTEKIKIKEFVGGIIRVLLFDPCSNVILFARVYDTGVVYSLWDFETKYTKDFFLIPSVNNAPATEFTSITFNDSANKLLLGASNFFVFGDWIRR
jgi:hypothetical protein